METVEFRRDNGWLPRVLRGVAGLRLEVVGGADALHDPRVFSLPIEAAHLEAIRSDLARHLILCSALLPLCRDAGIDGPLDEGAAVALLDPLLLGAPDEVDAALAAARWDRGQLVAHGADLALLDRGKVHAAMRSARETADWSRAQEDDAHRRRAQRGVTLAPLDEAVLRYTGQFLHGSTLPRRLPDAVDPTRLPDVLRVVETAERASAGLRIARDPRRGARGTDKADWTRMETAVEAALRQEHPGLARDAVRTVSFLLCSEAAHAARDLPYDPEGAGDAGSPVDSGSGTLDRVLAFSDDAGHDGSWWPGSAPSAVEAFWGFVAEHYGSKNEVFTVEDEAAGDGIQLLLYADALARVSTMVPARGGSEPVYRVEYGMVDDLAQYRAAVRGFVAGGFDALDGLCRWYDDADAFEAARRTR
ncbi:DUF6357 family protein [Leucobacter rhizosphaerae]|uniref:DUF6357 family protein n=1 Tax=Leucobacter rhizosphaerae TaxID=2932245 RepID=A0ABY4FV43_9MICO|nr:DUF6357 family protein [Leucobacter rhizosphaerae]UOQ60145.1 DUF6357 family protein [Leucobacter rhizosphaerae]